MVSSPDLAAETAVQAKQLFSSAVSSAASMLGHHHPSVMQLHTQQNGLPSVHTAAAVASPDAKVNTPCTSTC